MNILELSEQEINRRKALDELRAMGINPYPAAAYPTDAYSVDIKNDCRDDEAERFLRSAASRREPGAEENLRSLLRTRAQREAAARAAAE